MLVPPPPTSMNSTSTQPTSWRDAGAIPSTSQTSAGAQHLPRTGHVLPATSPWSPLRRISPEASMRWSAIFLQWPLATVSPEGRDPAWSPTMVRGRLPQRRAQGAIPLSLSTARGQPDMNTLHLILPKPSLPLLTTEGLTGSLLTRLVVSLKQASSSSCSAGRRPVVAEQGDFINTMKERFTTML